MNQISEMLRTSGKFHDKIKSFCSPLEQSFGISHFYHAKVTNTGHFIGVNLNRAWEEYFLSNSSHLLIWPDKCQPRKVQGGVRLLQEGESQKLNHLLDKARSQYSVHFSLQFVEKSNQGSNMYGFALNSANPLQHMALVKELPLLRLFMRRFQEEFKSLYNALDENKVNLSTLLGPAFHKVKNPAIMQFSMRDQLIKKMGIQIPEALTERELDIIKYLIQGCPASLIATQLFIAKRTVEHHIDRIKDKFHAASKSD